MTLPSETGLYLLPAAVAFGVTVTGTHVIIPRLVRSKIMGLDAHKPGRPPAATMGGIAIFAGIFAGISAAVGISTFADPTLYGRPSFIAAPIVVAALVSIGIIAIIGVTDDIIVLRHRTKALLPLLATLPLVAAAAGDPRVVLSHLGLTELSSFYPLLVIPLAIAAAANATNLLSGWNGLEAGLGLVLFGTLGLYGAIDYNPTLLSMAVPAAMACLGFLTFNWSPARVFPGGVGTYTIGATFGVIVVVNNVEFLGAILMVPFLMDFAMKARHRFPKALADVDGERLTCPAGQPPKGLGQLVLSVSGGMTERALVATLLALESLFAVAGLLVMSYAVPG